MTYQAYPKWVPVDGPGHPNNPGFVLVETEDQELEVMTGGEAPKHLNPEPNPVVEEEPEEGDKPVRRGRKPKQD